MDSALAFLPLTFSKLDNHLSTNHPLITLYLCAAHRFFNVVSAVSTLEFALRFFSPPNPNEWVLHEQHTENGGGARTFSTGRLWDRDGRCVASMSQQSIMRARAEKMGVAKL
jgi:acyl-CoA thioesterase